jgi:hypothetical protein
MAIRRDKIAPVPNVFGHPIESVTVRPLSSRALSKISALMVVCAFMRRRLRTQVSAIHPALPLVRSASGQHVRRPADCRLGASWRHWRRSPKRTYSKVRQWERPNRPDSPPWRGLRRRLLGAEAMSPVETKVHDQNPGPKRTLATPLIILSSPMPTSNLQSLAQVRGRISAARFRAKQILERPNTTSRTAASWTRRRRSIVDAVAGPFAAINAKPASGTFAVYSEKRTACAQCKHHPRKRRMIVK